MGTMQVILVVLSVAVLVIAVGGVLLWRQIRLLQQMFEQLEAALQRNEHDIAQQRYAIAVARRPDKATSENREEANDDQKVMDLAISHIEEKATPKTETEPASLPLPKVLEELKPHQVLQFLTHAIKNNEIAISLQPTMKMLHRTVTFFEVFARIKVGDQGFIPAGKFISVARDNNLMTTVDNLLLLRCLQLIKRTARADSTIAYFVNISVATLANKTYVNDLVSFLSANPRLSTQLVFEFRQEDTLHASHNVRQVIDALALLGCRFSMDQVGLLGLDVDRLHDLHIGFVKLDAALMAQEMQNPDRRMRMKKLKKLLEAAGITVILEKVENERQLLSLTDLSIGFAQGYFLGRPQEVA